MLPIRVLPTTLDGEDAERYSSGIMDAAAEVSRLLERWQAGDADAFDALVPLVYTELRRIAGALFRNERAGHTLQTTALVNEAYLRLVGTRSPPSSRAQFFGAAAQAMRRVLVDHARRRAADKRIDANARVTLIEAAGVQVQDAGERLEMDVLALHEALEKLAAINPRQARVVELRYFGGLSREEVAEVLGISDGSVARDWRLARMMLKHFVSGKRDA